MQNLGSRTRAARPDPELESRLDQALAKAPSPSIPADFAARVGGMVPARETLPEPRFAYARNSMALCAVCLLAGLMLLAPHARAGSTFAIAFEWTLCAQFSLLALFVALPRSPWRSGR